jgi:hypothetical protein
LRSGCQQPPLSVGQFHGILHSVATAIGAATTEARNGHEAGGAGFFKAVRARNGNSSAPFAPESQSLLVEAVEEVFVRRIRSDQQGAQFEIVRPELACPSTAQGMYRRSSSHGVKVEVLLHRELADLVDLRGVDLLWAALSW